MKITTVTHSVLENNIVIPLKLAIGSYATTQWGKRRVIAHIQVALSAPRTEPFGV